MINRWLGSGNRFILDRVGEAETGSGGDQPDRGIAGRNSSRTMRRAWSSRRVLLPGARTDRREAVGPVPRVWFLLDHIGAIDSVMPPKTHPDGRRKSNRRGSPVNGAEASAANSAVA